MNRRGIPLLAGLGVLVSGYLTWIHYGGGLALCTGAAGCETVQASRYAVVAGVPVALLGLVTYLSLLGLGVWRPGPDRSEVRRLALFGVALAGTLYSAYLTYLELFVVRTICPWCVSSAVVMTAILALVGVEMVAPAGEPGRRRSDHRGAALAVSQGTPSRQAPRA